MIAATMILLSTFLFRISPITIQQLRLAVMVHRYDSQFGFSIFSSFKCLLFKKKERVKIVRSLF